MKIPSPVYLYLLLPLALAGCAQSYEANARVSKNGYLSTKDSEIGWEGEKKSASGKSEFENSDPQKMELERKIIYTANLSVVVENFDPVESAIQSLVKKFGGFISNSKVNEANRQRRRGTWTVRIPVKSFDEFLDATGSLGVPVSSSQKADDVSEEYWDIEARIANKKKLEARILQLLERPEDEIKQIIEVERELARVRGDIERMEGRIRYLSNRVSLTTVTIEVIEEQEYKPAQTPTFSNRITKAWNSSLENTQDGFEDCVVVLVANALPILFWIIAIPTGWIVIRRFLKK